MTPLSDAVRCAGVWGRGGEEEGQVCVSVVCVATGAIEIALSLFLCHFFFLHRWYCTRERLQSQNFCTHARTQAHTDTQLKHTRHTENELARETTRERAKYMARARREQKRERER